MKAEDMPVKPIQTNAWNGKDYRENAFNNSQQFHYEQALQAAKESSVPIQDQDEAWRVIHPDLKMAKNFKVNDRGSLSYQIGNHHFERQHKADTIYGPFTVGYRIEKQCQYKDTDGNCPDCFRGSLCQKIAIIKGSNEDEYQVWLEYGELEMMYSFEGAEKNVSNPSRYVFDKLKEKFTITRKP